MRSRGPTLTLTSGGPGPRSLCGRRGGKQQLRRQRPGASPAQVGRGGARGDTQPPCHCPRLSRPVPGTLWLWSREAYQFPPGLLGETFLFVCGLAGAFGGSLAGSEKEGTVEMHARLFLWKAASEEENAPEENIFFFL